MEWARECGSIQADLARRAGLLLKQYSKLTEDLPEKQKFDATLALAVLGLLLVNCKEALATLEKDKRTHLLWPDIQSIVLEHADSNFPPPVDGKIEADAIAHLRNAMSHPLPERQDLLPLTGYTSRPVGADPSQTVARLEFVSSPWMNDQGLVRGYTSPNQQIVRSSLGRFARNYRCDGVCEVQETSPRLYSVVNSQTGAPYIPVFTLRLELGQVETLALSLANFLAHGALPSWNGEALNELLTA